MKSSFDFLGQPGSIVRMKHEKAGKSCHEKTETRLNVRVSPQFHGLRARLARASKTTGIRESRIVLQAVSSVCDFIEKHGEISFPVKITTRAIEETIASIEKLIAARQ